MVQCRDSNSQRVERATPAITTRSGIYLAPQSPLCPYRDIAFTFINIDKKFSKVGRYGIHTEDLRN